MYRTWVPRDMFAEIDRMQRELQQAFDLSPNIRGAARGGYPAVNAGGTPQSVEVYAFAPGLDPAGIDVHVEKGVLTISGERLAAEKPENATVHIAERFAGRFRRVVSLPDDIDAETIRASYRDGVLHVSVARKTATQPRRVTIQ